MRRTLRNGVLLGLLVGAALALVKLLGGRSQPTVVAATGGGPTPPWPRLDADPTVAAPPTQRAIPDPDAPAPAAARATAAPAEGSRTWVEAADGTCPTSHPVKAKLSSKIFHLPGMLNYERTNPDRCYRDGTAAEADGLRAAKR